MGSKRVGYYRLIVYHSQGQELGSGVQLWSFIGQQLFLLGKPCE